MSLADFCNRANVCLEPVWMDSYYESIFFGRLVAAEGGQSVEVASRNNKESCQRLLAIGKYYHLRVDDDGDGDDDGEDQEEDRATGQYWRWVMRRGRAWRNSKGSVGGGK